MIDSDERRLDAIDREVATKVMGLEVCTCDHKELRRKHHEEENSHLARLDPFHVSMGYMSHGSNRCCNACNKRYMPASRFSRDLDRALELVDFIVPNETPPKRGVTMTRLGGWRVTFRFIRPGFGTLEAIGESALGLAEAICSAALVAKERGLL